MILFILATVLVVSSSAENIAANVSSGFGYELLLAKMDYLEYKFLELQTEVKEQSEAVLIKASEILGQQKVFADHEAFKQSIFNLQPKKHPSDNSKLIQFLTEGKRKESEEVQFITSCGSDSVKQSGRYFLKLNNTTSFEVYCEQQLHDGGWLVIQNRFNGSVDFYKNWTDYKYGFGSLDGEFWFGLDRIAQLTLRQNRKLLIHLEDFNGVVKHALYETFAIGGEEELYKLKVLSGYSGTAGDSLKEQFGRNFSTPDRDNDGNSGNCAVTYHGSWWYNNCHNSNLNGLYKNGNGDEIMSWYYFGSDRRGLKISKMMIKY